ncbi:hypothetical protein ACVW19_004982 [Streptomyces sp. TE5632]
MTRTLSGSAAQRLGKHREKRQRSGAPAHGLVPHSRTLHHSVTGRTHRCRRCQTLSQLHPLVEPQPSQM